MRVANHSRERPDTCRRIPVLDLAAGVVQVILLCRPKGRGNWRVITLGLDIAADLFTVKRGDVLHLGQLVLRVVEIRV